MRLVLSSDPLQPDKKILACDGPSVTSEANAGSETEAGSPANSNPSTLVPYCGRTIYWWMHLQPNLLINETAWFMDKISVKKGKCKAFLSPDRHLKRNLFVYLRGNWQ